MERELDDNPALERTPAHVCSGCGAPSSGSRCATCGPGGAALDERVADAPPLRERLLCDAGPAVADGDRAICFLYAAAR